MGKETHLTSMNIDAILHKRTKMYCAMHGTDITTLVTGLLADFMKGRRVR